MALVLACTLLALSCGSGGAPAGGLTGPSQGTTYVFIGDTPPASSSILKFEITLSQAELCPTISQAGACQGTPVTLVGSPAEIELDELQLRSAFLTLHAVTTGSYGGVRLTFSNPRLKILLANGTVQDLEGLDLPLSPAAVTTAFSSALNVAARSNVSFLIDFNVRDSIQSATGAVTGISPVVSLVQLPASGTQPIEDLQDTVGQISNLSTSCPTGSFTLTSATTGLAIASVQFDDTTVFDGDLTCATLANEQVVEADVELQSTSAESVQFFAKNVELLSEAGDEGLEGVVFQVNSTGQFVLMVSDEHNLSSLSSGDFVTVNADPTEAVFGIESTDLPVNSSAFASGADLFAGQTVDLAITPGSLVMADAGCATLADACSASATALRLKKSILTAQVSGTSVPNFTVTGFGFQLAEPLRQLHVFPAAERRLPVLRGRLDDRRHFRSDAVRRRSGRIVQPSSWGYCDHAWDPHQGRTPRPRPDPCRLSATHSREGSPPDALS